MSVELAPGITVEDYARIKQAEDAPAIGRMIRGRFLSRYLDPVDHKCGIRRAPRHGFTMMAIACLMIEALECFREGVEDSTGQSQQKFAAFFHRSRAIPSIDSRSFYKHIRCGILHQAETTGGWRIRRSGPLYDKTRRAINAARFIKCMRDELDSYCNELASCSWNDELLKHAVKKLDHIAGNAVANS